jgi:hypothetical protein
MSKAAANTQGSQSKTGADIGEMARVLKSIILYSGNRMGRKKAQTTQNKRLFFLRSLRVLAAIAWAVIFQDHRVPYGTQMLGSK